MILKNEDIAGFFEAHSKGFKAGDYSGERVATLFVDNSEKIPMNNPGPSTLETWIEEGIQFSYKISGTEDPEIKTEHVLDYTVQVDGSNVNLIKQGETLIEP